MPTAGGCWINMRGSFWRCANEQIRPATYEEGRGAELINRYLSDLRWDSQHNKGPKKYVDVRAEGHPIFPNEDTDHNGDGDYQEPELSEDDEQLTLREPES